MKQIFIFLLFLLLLFPVNSLILPDGTDAIILSLEEYEDGSIKSVKLGENTPLGTPYGTFLFIKDEKINYYPSGAIKSGIVSEKQEIETSFGNIHFELIKFYESGTVEKLTLPKDQPQSIVTQNGRILVNEITFHENSMIKSASLSAPQIINSPVGRLKVFGKIIFHETGMLKEVFLSGSQVIETNIGRLPISFIKLYEDGGIKAINLSTPKTIFVTEGEFVVDEIIFDKNGNISSFNDVNALQDGYYIAQEDSFCKETGWKEYVILYVKNNKISSVSWNAIHNEKEDDRKTLSKKNQDDWYIQAGKVETWLMETQGIKKYSIRNESFDSIQNVHINFTSFEALVNKAISNEPFQRPKYKDGTYYAEEDEFSSAGWRYFIKIKVLDGFIVDVEWNSISQKGEYKKTIDKAGEYQMVARGGAQAEWYIQAERVERSLLENQNLDCFTSINNGYADSISGVTINIGVFVHLSEKALQDARK